MYYQNRPGPRGHFISKTVVPADSLLPVDYIHQEKSCYCGPASLQMVISANGQTTPAQFALYTDTSHELIPGESQPVRENEACTAITEGAGVWKSGSTPEGMSQTLLTHMASVPTEVAQWTSSTNSEALTRKMCWAIRNGRPSIALVYGRSHWIVVTGYHLSQAPTSSVDGEYEIDYLYINNPYSSARDDSGLAGKYLAEIVDYAHWQRLYVRDPVYTPDDPTYDGLHIAIIDAEAEGAFPDYEYHSAVESFPDLMDEAAAVMRAQDYAASHPVIALHQPWNVFPGIIEPINPDRAHLVTEGTLDQDESYLVLFRESSNVGESEIRIALAIMIGARDGLFRGARATYPEEGLSIYVGSAVIASLLPEDVIPYLHDTGIRVDGVEELYYPDLGQTPAIPVLFWEPSLESLSPYLPFYAIQAATLDDPSNVVTIYVRLDGRAFLGLTEAIGA